LYYDINGDCTYYFAKFTSAYGPAFDVSITPRDGAVNQVLVDFYPKKNSKDRSSQVYMYLDSNGRIKSQYRQVHKDHYHDEDNSNEIDNKDVYLLNLGSSASAILWFDVEIRFIASSNTIELFVPALYKTSGSGLCGNFNDDPTDDLTGPDLTLYPNNDEGLSEFDCSWTWNQEECTCGITEAECTPTNDVLEACDKILDGNYQGWPNSGWWGLCHAWVDPQPYYDNCIRDYCKDQNQLTLCDVYDSYTMACMAAQPYSTGYDRLCEIPRISNCIQECPDGLRFDGCAKPCGQIGTCANPPVDMTDDFEDVIACLEDPKKVASCVCVDTANTLYDPVNETCIPKNQCPARGLFDFL